MSASNRKERLKKEYPLHWLVWHNDAKALDEELRKKKIDIEKRDPRGRTALMLAVTMGFLESSKVLLQHNAHVGIEHKDGFTVVHEAVSTGDPEMVQEVLERRDFQRHSSRIGGIPELLKRIEETPDFYVEMKWEFTSWVPLVSRMCPSDTYKVYKCGSNVRIDTTLLGFDQSSWQRGSRSYIFKGLKDSAVMMEVDHELGQVYVEQMRVLPPTVADVTSALRPSTKAVSARLTSPIVMTFIDTEKISFERNKAGIWGWRSDKTEVVNNNECKVFSANNVELVTKTRSEHLTDADKSRHRVARSPIQSFLGIVESQEKIPTSPVSLVNGVTEGPENNTTNPSHISLEDYLDSSVDLQGRDVGRPREVTTKVQKFKATLWLCEDYPLSLQEQILPIVDLMAISSTHFAKLRDFITLQLPSGFPVKIEIPLFHVLNARITFGNIFGMDEPVLGITPVVESNVSVACVVDENCFEPPSGYARLGSDELRQLSIDEDDELLQFAIQQSLMEAGSEEDQVTIWEALRAEKPASLLHSEEDHALQRAIQESMGLLSATDDVSFVDIDQNTTVQTSQAVQQPATDEQLEMALRLSQQVQEEEDRQRQEEEATLERILQLSLSEK